MKTRFIEANKFPPNAVKVVTERGVVYLMGIVTRPEGDAAGETAATTDGVGASSRSSNRYKPEPAIAHGKTRSRASRVSRVRW